MSLLCLLLVAVSPAAAFDFDSDLAPAAIIPNIIPVIYSDVSPNAGDATLVLRITTLVTNSWFDAIAPYHPTAVGVYSNLGRRPAVENTQRNKNTAIFYASYRILNSLLPARNANWRAVLLSVGLDPDNNSTDLTTPIGIGNTAGMAVAAAREQDGMNQLGDAGGRVYNRIPYADYTGYEPVNSAYDLKDPSRWQPAIVTSGNGIFRVQQFVTPQYRFVTPYSYNNPNMFNVPPPQNSNPKGSKGRQAYKAQADEVLAASANLTDKQKMTAEFFDDKLRSLGFSALFILQTRNLTLDQFVQFDFVLNMAAFDAGIATWNQKAKWDAVRPFSAIQHLYGNRPVTAWGGPGRGTVTDLPASQWRSYLAVADHPEYPSGSSCFCAAHGQAARRYLGTDNFGWAVPLPAGSSRVEPGITPAGPVTLGPWATWTEFEEDCGESRIWGGVHFRAAVDESKGLCAPIGDLAFQKLQRHLAGNP